MTAKTKDELLYISQKFQARWKYSDDPRAIAGRQIVPEQPFYFGSRYRNCKDNDSIVLMRITDHEYKFSYVDVGMNARNSDGGIWEIVSWQRHWKIVTLTFLILHLYPIAPKIYCPFALATMHLPYHLPYTMKQYPFKNLTDDQNVATQFKNLIQSAFSLITWIANRKKITCRKLSVNLCQVCVY